MHPVQRQCSVNEFQPPLSSTWSPDVCGGWGGGKSKMLWRKRQILLLMWEQIPPLSCSSSPEESLQGHSTQVILQWKYTAFCVAGVSNIQVKVKATKGGAGEASPQFTNMIAALLGIRPSGDRLLSSFIGDRVCQWVSAKFITSILCGDFKLSPEEPTFKV